MTKIPEGSGIEWMIAAGISDEEINKVLEKEKLQKEIIDCYEKSMGYNPLPWNKMERLLKFLVTKTPEQIKQFASWSRKEFSTFTPAKARQFPDMVIDLWPQAFPVKEETGMRGQEVSNRINEFFNKR